MITPLHLNENTTLGSILAAGISSTLLSDVAEVLDDKSTSDQSDEGIPFES